MRSLSTFVALALALAASPASAVLYRSPADLATLHFDYIVVGGGTAGNVVANRLTEDPRVSVLVLEAGPSNTDVYNVAVPALAVTLSPGGPADWGYTTVPQKALYGRRVPYPRGRVLGGSSSINYMIWNRGSRDDFDYYAKVTGTPGLSWNNMIKYWNKVEKYVAPNDGHNPSSQFSPSQHSTTGMVPISLPSNPFGQDKGIIGVTQELPDEFPYAEDMNTGNPIGIGYVQAAIGNGTRSSSASTYVGPDYQKRPNLSILVQAQATKVIQTGTFRGKPIFGGVEFVVSGTTKRYNVSADKEVIISAGTFNTPQLLLNSGIGDKKALTGLKIKPLVDLPDVGQQMTDHTLLGHCYSVNITNTLDGYFHDTSSFNQALGQWNASRSGIFTSTITNNIGFLRVPPTDPIFKTFKDPSTGPTSGHYEFFFGATFNLPNITYPGGNFACIYTQTMAPSSRGSITLASNDPLAPPLIDPNFIGDAFDVNTMVVAQKAAIKYYKSKAMAYMNPQPFGEWADVINNGTDAALIDYARKNSMTIWHACSSARMSPFGANYGVVDPDHRVKGTLGLRVVDASVIPYVPSTHPMGPVYAFAERASDQIKTT